MTISRILPTSERLFLFTVPTVVTRRPAVRQTRLATMANVAFRIAPTAGRGGWVREEGAGAGIGGGGVWAGEREGEG